MPPGLIKFEEFELDCARYELRRKGHALKLEKIPMELLMLLVAFEGRLVSREEIEARLWGKDVFVDVEHGINTAIRKIRQVLGDDPEHPRFVQTVQRKGYRFIGQATQAEEVKGQNGGAARGEEANIGVGEPIPGELAQQLPVTQVKSATAAKRTRGRMVWIGVAAALVLALPVYKLALPRLTRSEAKPAAIRSIAVLPLENISGDQTQEYFADGMTDELITTLAKYRSLRVISRTSVMQYKKARRPLPEIARELGVDGIVEGTVSRSKDRVRVTAQLIYAPTDTHLWSESYDRDLGDVLPLQQEVARSIAEQVETVSSVVRNSDMRPRRTNPAAQDAYFRGRYYWFSSHYDKSRELFEEAIKLDPSYAAAYSGLADTYTAANAEGRWRPRDVMPLAEAAAKKGLELDDSLAEAHHSLAAINFFYRWDWGAAERESERALALNPGLAEAHHIHAYILSAENRMDEAIQEDKRTNELDPFARPWAYGYALLRARRFDEAINEFKQRIEARPDSADLHGILSTAYAYKGDFKNAMEEMKKAFLLNGEEAMATQVEQSYENGGFPLVKQRLLDRLKQQSLKEYTSALRMAEAAAWAGHHEEAIRYLEQAFEEHDAQLAHLQHNPALDPLHSDPRYWAIVKKMGMPPLK